MSADISRIQNAVIRARGGKLEINAQGNRSALMSSTPQLLEELARLSSKQWRSLDFQGYSEEAEEHVAGAIETLDSLETLKCVDLRGPIIAALGRGCPRLEELTIQYISTPSGFEYSWVSQLKALSLSMDCLEEHPDGFAVNLFGGLGRCSGLRTLNFDRPWIWTWGEDDFFPDPHLIPRLDLPNLTSLSLSGDPRTFEYLASPSLVNVVIHFDSSNGRQEERRPIAIPTSIIPLPNLTSLEIISAEALPILAFLLAPQLESLTISNCWNAETVLLPVFGTIQLLLYHSNVSNLSNLWTLG